jgi:hypothetical protein
MLFKVHNKLEIKKFDGTYREIAALWKIEDIEYNILWISLLSTGRQ